MTFGKPRFLGVLESEYNLAKATRIVVSSARGTELALNIGPSDPEKVAECRQRLLGAPTDSQAKGGEPPFQDLDFERIATGDDIETRRHQEKEEEQILISARKMLREHKLPMKLVDVEYLLDAKKLFFYFTAEQRIDFRAYVRDLARAFKTRIELRQIGVRDEAKVVKGLAPCGMPCCCSYWLERFDPICIKMVKEQNLALNPAKISGICGRLMCCMAFEHDMYHELWQNLPNPGTKIKTPGANYILSSVDIRSQSVHVFHPEKGEIVVAVKDFDDFKACVQEGKTWEGDNAEKVAQKELTQEMAMNGNDAAVMEDQACQKDSRSSEALPPGESRPERKDKRQQNVKEEDTSSPKTEEKKKRRRSSRKKSRRKKAGTGASPDETPPSAQGDKKEKVSDKNGIQGKSRRRKPRKRNRPSRDQK